VAKFAFVLQLSSTKPLPAERCFFNFRFRVYHSRLRENGASVQTVGWGSRADQAIRFEVSCRHIALVGSRILDLGCGLGDFVSEAEARFGKHFEYVGLDLSAEMVREAARIYAGAGRQFFEGTLTEDGARGDFDVVLLSGTLTFSAVDNLLTMRALLKNAWKQFRGVLS
jgi:2-polyprenyl-3-methyl-5-hydroxy-6-metoxy-1,4-benzoquinol methylase